MDGSSKDIGELIQDLRTEKGVSLRALSRKAGLSPASLSSIEKGKGNPTLATFHKLLKGLGTDFAQFYDRVVQGADVAREALDADSVPVSADKWRELFGTKFPPPGDGSGGERAKGPFIEVSQKGDLVPRRYG